MLSGSRFNVVDYITLPGEAILYPSQPFDKMRIGVDASEAVGIVYRLGDERALELLLAYNQADCENLKPLAEYAVKELWSALRGRPQPL